MARYYPIFARLDGRACVVVGGGPVAERKVAALLDHGASVTVVSPTLTPGLRRLASDNAIMAVLRDYRDGDLAGAFLAIAATGDPAANRAVAREGRRRRTLVNVVDDPEESEFIVPSIVRRGDLTVAISTSGRSPALARRLRAYLESLLPAEYESVLSIVSDVRQEVMSRGADVDAGAWQRCLDLDRLQDMAREGRTDEARRMLLECLIAARQGPRREAPPVD